jgi:dienelactone hydrolase
VAAAACLDSQTLAEPDRFYVAPPPVELSRCDTLEETAELAVEAIRFPSAVPFGIASNDMVNLRLYRPTRRAIRFNLLMLHGVWRQDRDFEDRICRDLARHGVRTALLSLPFHWDRAGAGMPSGAEFISADPLWTAAAFRQAIVDARAALTLLRGNGAPVGLVGFSLGGILAHVLMTLEPLDLGMSVLAGGNVAGVVWDGLLTRAYRLAMQAQGVTRARLSALWTLGNATAYAARVKARRIVMINGRYDAVVPTRFTHELWQALGQPPIRWLAAGHITAFLFHAAIMEEILAAIGLRERARVRGCVPRLAPAPAR